MRPSECIRCEAFPCQGVRHECYLVPEVDVRPEDVQIVLISETAPPDSADWYYAGLDGRGRASHAGPDGGSPDTLRPESRGPRATFEQTTVQAFRDAGADVSSIADVLRLGVYLTTAVKCAKTGNAVSTATVAACSRLLEQELSLFPDVRAWLLMGDVAIKAVNAIAKRAGEPRVIPAGPTYKLRSGEYAFRGARAFPSYLQVGPCILIEKGKLTVIAQDIAAALTVAAEGQTRAEPDLRT